MTVTTGSPGGGLPPDPCALRPGAQIESILGAAPAGQNSSAPEQADSMIECSWDTDTGRLTLRVLDLGAMGVPNTPAASQLPSPGVVSERSRRSP